MHRLVDVEYAAVLLEQLDEVFAGGDILATLHTGLVMQDIEALKNKKPENPSGSPERENSPET